jgi:hypothetical protein
MRREEWKEDESKGMRDEQNEGGGEGGREERKEGRKEGEAQTLAATHLYTVACPM